MSDYIGIGGSWKLKAGEWIGVGGSWKRIAGEWIGVGGAWKPFASAVSAFVPFTTTMTAGASGTENGYSQGAFGSLSPNDPQTVNADGAVLNEVVAAPEDIAFVVSISGLTADPGQDYFTSVNTNAAGIDTKTTATAASYSYAGGVATWTWGESSEFTPSTAYSLVFS